MSHFSTVVICPPEIKDAEQLDDIESFITKAMEPYSEERMVPAYEEECWCVAANMRQFVNDKLALEFGDPRYDYVVGRFRDTFAARRDAIMNEYGARDPFVAPAFEKGTPEYIAEEAKLRAQEKALEAAWKEHVKPLTDAQERAEAQAVAEGANKPNPDCAACGGTGITKSTYNPDSKWDWYMIGGRWDGVLAKLPEQNLTEVCSVCGGSGNRPGALEEFGEDWVKQMNGCNGCKGSGKQLVWPTDERFASPDRNICTMAQATEESPYSFVTPDGAWHGRAEMGWFGASYNEKEEAEWEASWTEARITYSHNIAVMLDCHI